MKWKAYGRGIDLRMVFGLYHHSAVNLDRTLFSFPARRLPHWLLTMRMDRIILQIPPKLDPECGADQALAASPLIVECPIYVIHNSI